MEEHKPPGAELAELVEKLLSADYDLEKKRCGDHNDVYGICKGYFTGVILFNGTVIVRNSITSFLEDRYLLVSNTRKNNLLSLYINPIKKIEGEEKENITELKEILEKGLCLPEIQPNDNFYINAMYDQQEGYDNIFHLVAEDARKRHLATFEFWKKGEMLYVPKRRNT